MIWNSINIGRGLLVKGGVLFFVLSFYFIVGQQEHLNLTFPIVGVFQKIEGLQVGSPVFYRGVSVGVIDNIEIIGDSSVKVQMLVREEIRLYIKKNSSATIVSKGVFGNKLVTIISENNSVAMLSPGDKLNSFQTLKVDQVIDEFYTIEYYSRSIAKNLNHLAHSVRKHNIIRDSLFFNMASKAQVNIQHIKKNFLQNSSNILSLKKNSAEIINASGEITSHLDNIHKKINSGNNPAMGIIELFQEPGLLSPRDISLNNIQGTSGDISQGNHYINNQIKNDTVTINIKH